MVLLDAYALIALLAGAEAEREVRALIDRGDTAVTTVNLIEVLDVTQRVAGVPAAEVDRVLTPLLGGALEVLEPGVDVARGAAAIRVGNYHRTDCPISLADCVLLASAAPGDAVATGDEHLISVAERNGREAIRLPTPAR